MGKVQGGQRAEGRALRAAGEAPAVHELPASAIRGKGGSQEHPDATTEIFPLLSSLCRAALGKGSGGREGCSGRAMSRPWAKRLWYQGDELGKAGMPGGSRCSSGEGTQQNPKPGADVRLMQIERVGSSIKIFSG